MAFKVYIRTKTNFHTDNLTIKNRSMTSKKRNIVVGFLIWAIIAGLIMFTDLRKKAKIEAQLNIEYPRIELQDSLDNIVKRTYLHEGFRHNPYFSRIEFQNNRKATLGVILGPNEPALQRVILPGTHIYKKAGCDTIWVSNSASSDSSKRFFLLREKGE
jgi:hypothetical protein